MLFLLVAVDLALVCRLLAQVEEWIFCPRRAINSNVNTGTSWQGVCREECMASCVVVEDGMGSLSSDGTTTMCVST